MKGQRRFPCSRRPGKMDWVSGLKISQRSLSDLLHKRRDDKSIAGLNQHRVSIAFIGRCRIEIIHGVALKVFSDPTFFSFSFLSEPGATASGL